MPEIEKNRENKTIDDYIFLFFGEVAMEIDG